MTRYNVRFIFIVLILIITGSLVLIQNILRSKPADSSRYNLILISVDTLRPDHMGTYGYNKNTSPNIDAWAKKSWVFNNVYTIMPITSHSFYTLFMGNDEAIKNGDVASRYVNFNNLKDLTLPGILKEKGYKTGAFITNPVIGDSNTSFFSNGFDEFDYVNNSKIKKKIPDIFVYTFDYKNSQEVTDKGKLWLDDNKNNPFFLWLHYTTPHFPYNPPKKYLCKIDKNCNSKIYDKLSKDLTLHDENLPSCSTKISDANVVKYKNLYDAEILSVDEEIGKVIKHLDELDLTKKSIVVFYSDHGEGFDHTVYGHGNTLYNSSLRIPLIIKMPGQEPKKISNLMDNSDILPTVLDLLKVDHSDSYMNSSDLASYLLKGQISNEKKYVISSSTIDKVNKIAILDGTYKYISSISDFCLYNNYKEELYNLKKDPEEKENIIDDEKDIADVLKNQLSSSGVATEISSGLTKESIDELRNLGY